VGSFARSLESILRIRNGGAMFSEDFRKQALGYGLTTAHILYRRPDHRWLLQSYVWQNYDLFPQFLELRRFLALLAEEAGWSPAFRARGTLQADQASGVQGIRRGIPAALVIAR
jgi:uncharacterized protein Usg